MLESIYASNSVTQMLSRKTISRALRGHLLVDRALTSVIINQTHGILI